MQYRQADYSITTKEKVKQFKIFSNILNFKHRLAILLLVLSY